MGQTPFDTFMILLPAWLPAAIVGFALQWLIIRGAVLSALRRHAADQRLHDRPNPDAGSTPVAP